MKKLKVVGGADGYLLCTHSGAEGCLAALGALDCLDACYSGYKRDFFPIFS